MTVEPVDGPGHLEDARRPARRRRRSRSTPTTPAAASRQRRSTIQVAGGSHAPVIGPLPSQVSGQEGQPLVLTVTATDPDGRPLVYWADNLPGGASFDPTTHTLLWEPAYGQAGTYNDVTFYVSDGVSTVSTSVTLLISQRPAAAAARRAAGPDRARGRPPALHPPGERRRRPAGHLLQHGPARERHARPQSPASSTGRSATTRPAP